jgi:hypothetical protein
LLCKLVVNLFLRLLNPGAYLLVGSSKFEEVHAGFSRKIFSLFFEDIGSCELEPATDFAIDGGSFD